MPDILIVDDDEDLAEILSSVLTDMGHQVRVAHDGLQGLRALDQRLPDAIVLDVEMPELDGPGMANELFIEDAGREQIPIVLISGYVKLEAIAARVGTPYFAAKPCSLDTLLELLDRALRERTAPTPQGLLTSAPTSPRPRPPVDLPRSASRRPGGRAPR